MENELTGRRGSRRTRILGCVTPVLLVAAVLCGALGVLFVVNNRIPDLHIPTHSVPKDNGLDYFVRGSGMVPMGKECGPYSNVKPIEDWTVPELRAWYVKAAPGIAVIREGLTRPCVRKPIRSLESDEMGPNPKIREDARTLEGAAYYFERTGHPGESANLLLDCMQMGAVIDHGGTLIDSLASAAVEEIGLSPMEHLIPDLNAAQLAHAAKRLAVIQSQMRTWPQIVREEEWSDLACFRESLTGLTVRQLYYAPSDLQGGESSPLAPRNVIDGIEFIFANKARILNDEQDNYETLGEVGSLPYTGRAQVKLIPTIFGDLPAGSGNIRVVFVARDAEMAVLRAYVAVLRYHLATESYPAHLANLVPKYLPSVPIDPFGGVRKPPLRYHLTARGYLLYSLGPNRKDDGGRAETKPRIMKFGDMVAGHLEEAFSLPAKKAHGSGK